MAGSRTVLVTGATGFIGSHLVNALVNAGDEVHIVTRKKTGLAVLEPVLPRLHVHEHDGSTEGMVSIVKSSSPEIVFHLATYFLASHKAENISDLIESNVLFGTQLLEAMDACSVRRLVNAGTTWQHYQDHPYDPVNLYSATKQAFEDLLFYYTSARALGAVTLELTDTYGPKDRRKKLFALLSSTAASGTPLAMSSGEQLMDLVYVDDVVQAFLQAGEMLANDQVKGHEKYQVAAGRRYSLREVAQIYEKISGKTLNIQWGGRPYRDREVMVPWQKGDKLPGWQPQISLEEGIRHMLAE